MKLHRTLFIFILIALVCASCRKDEEEMTDESDQFLQAEKGEEYSGGLNNTVFSTSMNAFGFQSPGLTGNDELFFFVGNSFFNQSWVSSPASTTARDGIGPTFNAFACSSCHFKDGRGRAPNFPGETSSGLLLRLSIDGVDQFGGPKPHATYGDQLQDKSVNTVLNEGLVNVAYEELEGRFPDGEKYSLRNPTYSITNLNYGALPSNIKVSPRVAQHVIGMGLIEAIDKADIEINEDVFDGDADGISGKANYVWSFERNQRMLGRFGWKANQPSVSQQTAAAFHGDMGITTPLFNTQNCPTPQIDCSNAPNGGDPEITQLNFEHVTLYVSNLAIPARRSHDDQEVLKGKQFFHKIGCGNCHKASYNTGGVSKFRNLNNQKIWPYSDFLLHDMGDALADNRPDYLADGNEWRTPPLWGVGLIETVNGHTNFLHDGRARSIEEAILWHGGEAENAQEAYINLPKIERTKLIKFINSL